MTKLLSSVAIFVLAIFVFFWQFTLKGLIPVPGDLIIGAYYPWLNSKWGYPTGVVVKNPMTTDVISQFYPLRESVIKSVKSGQLPLWNRSYFLGTTLIGNVQAGIFNPFNILFFTTTSFSKGWGWQVLSQFLLTLLGMYALLRIWNRSHLGSILGSLSYAFSGQMIMWAEYNVHGFIFATVPIALYFLHKAYTKNKKYLLYLSPLIAFSLFAGYPQMAYYLIGFLVLYAIYLISSQDKTTANKFLDISAFGFAVMLGLGLSSIQSLPGFTTLSQSIRDVDKVAASFGVQKLPIEHLVSSLIPDFFGNPATYNYWGQGTYESFTFYTSVVALSLALLTIGRVRKNLQINFLWLVASLSLLISLATPLTSWIQSVSILGLKGSTSVRILFAYGFAISSLAAFGFDQVTTRIRSSKIVLVIPALIGVIATGVIILSRSNPVFTIAFRNSLWPFLIATASAVAFYLFRKKSTLLGVTLVLLIFIDMFRFGAKYLPFTSPNLLFPPTPTTSWLSSQPSPFRIAFAKAELFPANSWSPYNLESLSGYDILVSKKTTDFISQINHGVPGLERARFIDIKNFDSQLLDTSDTKYVVLLDKGPLKTPHLDPSRYRQVFTEEKVQVWENLTNKGRYYDAQNQCQISHITYLSNSSRFETDCKASGKLIISEPNLPGWKVFINSVKVGIRNSKGFFMEVDIPSGKSQVVMSYFPTELIVGAGLSALSLLIWIKLTRSGFN